MVIYPPYNNIYFLEIKEVEDIHLKIVKNYNQSTAILSRDIRLPLKRENKMCINTTIGEILKEALNHKIEQEERI